MTNTAGSPGDQDAFVGELHQPRSCPTIAQKATQSPGSASPASRHASPITGSMCLVRAVYRVYVSVVATPVGLVNSKATEVSDTV